MNLSYHNKNKKHHLYNVLHAYNFTFFCKMKFKILSANSAQELEQLKRVRSHLALGVFYAHEGLVGEAEREFQILVRENPRTPALKKLLSQIQSWRRSE